MTEDELAARVMDALLRENYGGLATRVNGDLLRLPCGGELELERDGFQADQRIVRGQLTLERALAVLHALADPRDAVGVTAFTTECRQALAELCLRTRHPVKPEGTLRHEALAAALPHPVYPASPAHLGLSDADLLSYAPEFCPEFELNWVAVPGHALTSTLRRPAWWPAPADVGLEKTAAELLPVHPLTARETLTDALAEAGIDGQLAPRRYLRVKPTLSLRTVAVTSRDHLKLPVPISTLGMRNRRSLAPAALADGALVHDILRTLTDTDPVLTHHLVLADDSGYAHAGHPFLACLHRRLPAGAESAVPVAALAAPGVLAELSGGDPTAFLAAYFDLIFGVHVRLFSRCGIALEAHQQNAALLPGPRLLVKDFDGALINHRRLMAALGPATPPATAFADQRLLTDNDVELANVFITIVVHLCAGALAFGLDTPPGETLRLARRSLVAALDRDARWPATALLRARVLDAPRLPIKAMVTAGTLVDRVRLSARDINKFYPTSGPNYLREDAWTRGL